MKIHASCVVFCVFVFPLLLAAPAVAQPASGGEDPNAKVSEKEVLKPAPESITVGAEYRLQSTRVDPFELSGNRVEDVLWTEQRLRMDLKFKRKGLVEFDIQFDALDGVLFGDNGVFNRDPRPNSGVSLSAKRPNNTSWTVGLEPGQAPLDRKNYSLVLREVEPIQVNHVYATAFLPFGVLRVGRQPEAIGANLAAHDGGRHNRWGVSRFGDTSDRVLVATKLDEAYKVITEGPGYKPDLSLDRGLFFAFAYDWKTQNKVWGGVGDARQYNFAFLYRQDEADWGGFAWKNVLLSSTFVTLQDDDFDSSIVAFPQKIQFSVENFSFLTQLQIIRGETREISEGFAALSNRESSVQNLKAQGLQTIADYKLGPVTLTMEFDFASGDSDPRSSTDITSYSFARDLNVGLLMFEHILAFESARSVGVGLENLSSLDSDSFPLTEVRTDGRFTNAIGLFPQVKVDMLESKGHKVHARFGTLFAWPAADGVVDPILTTLSEDGNEIEDDAVNFHGGKPGGYYGTEFDFQLEWDIRKSFTWTIEAAYLMPGSSLKDEHGDAVDAYLLENRFVYTF